MVAKFIAIVLLPLLVIVEISMAEGDILQKAVDKSFNEELYNHYSKDKTGFSYRGGVNFLPHREGGGKVAELEMEGGRQGCGGFNWISNFKSTFNSEALESYVKGLVSNALSSAPLVLMCYVSPTLCDAYKHFKAITNMVMQARLGQCQSIENAAMTFGKYQHLKKEGQVLCLEEKQKEGKSLQQAIDTCSASQSIPDYTGIIGKDVNLVGDLMEKSDFDKPTRELIKSLMGEITYKSDGTQKRNSNSASIEATYKQDLQDFKIKLKNLIEKVSQGGDISISDIKEISFPGNPITPDVIKAIAAMPKYKKTIAINKLASALAAAKLVYQTQVLTSTLHESLNDPHAEGTKKEILEKEITNFRKKVEDLLWAKKTQDELLAPIQAILQESEAEHLENFLSRSSISPPENAKTTRNRLKRSSFGGAE